MTVIKVRVTRKPDSGTILAGDVYTAEIQESAMVEQPVARGSALGRTYSTKEVARDVWRPMVDPIVVYGYNIPFTGAWEGNIWPVGTAVDSNGKVYTAYSSSKEDAISRISASAPQ